MHLYLKNTQTKPNRRGWHASSATRFEYPSSFRGALRRKSPDHASSFIVGPWLDLFPLVPIALRASCFAERQSPEERWRGEGNYNHANQHPCFLNSERCASQSARGTRSPKLRFADLRTRISMPPRDPSCDACRELCECLMMFSRSFQ